MSLFKFQPTGALNGVANGAVSKLLKNIQPALQSIVGNETEALSQCLNNVTSGLGKGVNSLTGLISNIANPGAIGGLLNGNGPLPIPKLPVDLPKLPLIS